MHIDGIDTFVTVIHNGDHSKVESRRHPATEPYATVSDIPENEADALGKYLADFWSDRGSMLITV